MDKPEKPKLQITKTKVILIFVAIFYIIVLAINYNPDNADGLKDIVFIPPM